MIMQLIDNFSQKIFKLVKHFIDIYSSAPFKLDTIDSGKDTSDTLVYFINIRTGEQYYKPLKLIFENKKLLKYFNSTDAAYIGYAYGRRKLNC